ncbi:16420_t:CDS:1, partial [Acaulospora morrowiae]
ALPRSLLPIINQDNPRHFENSISIISLMTFQRQRKTRPFVGARMS